MVIVAAHSDRTGKKVTDIAAASAASASALSVAPRTIAGVCRDILVARRRGSLSLYGPFVSVEVLDWTAAAGGIALINSLSNLSGFAGPYAIGLLNSASGDFRTGLLLLAMFRLPVCSLRYDYATPRFKDVDDRPYPLWWGSPSPGAIGCVEWPNMWSVPGYLQANLVIVSEDIAVDFMRFVTAIQYLARFSRSWNPVPLNRAILPATRIFAPICLATAFINAAYWSRKPSISCAGGGAISSHFCSGARLASRLRCCVLAFLRVISSKAATFPCIGIKLPCEPAGAFFGPLVVTMRPLVPAQAIEAAIITSRYPQAHGAPIHFGDPQSIGIADLTRPDFGDAVSVRAGEVPVFWACGVTTLAAVIEAKPELAIAHAPVSVFVTDRLADDNAITP